MSKLIDLVETFDFSSLTVGPYYEKIDGLLKRFPKYEKDNRFRTVLPDKSIRTADDYFSIKLCMRGRYPIYGIYKKRDLNLVGVCVHGNIMYALDDCDLHPSFVPDLKVCNVYLQIQYTPLATREMLNYTRKCICSAISTLSLGYTPQKKNEWCEAIVLLTGITSQAVRFGNMKKHVAFGLPFTKPHSMQSFDGRYNFFNGQLAMQSRWNKVSKAIRRGNYPYVLSSYANNGAYLTQAMCEYSAPKDVLLINDRDKTKQEESTRRMDRWNGPLGNSIRKREEESCRRWFMEREAKPIMNNNSSERMHGFWHGSVDTFKYKVACESRLPGLAQIVSDNRFLVSGTSRLACLKHVLQAQTTLASIFMAVQNIWDQDERITVDVVGHYQVPQVKYGAVHGLNYFQSGTSTILENPGVNLDGPDSNFWLRRPKPNPSLQVATYKAIVDRTRPVLSAATFYLCAKHCEVKVDKMRMQSDFNNVSTSTKDMCFGHLGTSNVKVDPEKLKLNQEPRPFVELSCGRSSGALGATCVCPLQVITTRMHAQHSNTKAGFSGMLHLFKRNLRHKGLGGFYKGLVPNLLNIVPSGRLLQM